MVACKRIALCEPPMACRAFTGYLPSARRRLFKGFAEAEWLASRLLSRGPTRLDASSADYINRNAKDAAYNELLQRLEERGLKSGLAPLKRKIKSLRDTYRSEIYKMKKSKKSGAGADDVYKPRLGSSCTSGYLLYNVNPSDPLADGDIYQLLVSSGY
ncbi:hypothetical protein JTB14_005958 [Gonioctena quinquepunctata]|nr:hypothetical protein JTB14_005958 [Gonioctena quinquepunctata]